MQRSVSRKVNFSITPTNDSSTSVSATNKIQGGYAFSGQNIIKFVIPASESMVETKTLNLDFQLITLNAARDPVKDLDNIELNNGQNMALATSINSNSWGGAQSVISKIMVQSLKSPVELSNQVNYSNYCSVYDANRYNENDYKDVPYIKHGCSGVNSQYTNRHFNISPDATATATGTMTNITGFLNDSAVGQYVSMQIKNPILSNSRPLHMGQDYFGGLVVTIYLEANAGYFSQRFQDAGSGQTYGDISNITYLVKNPRLRGKYIFPSDDQEKAYSNELFLNSRVSLINDIQSSTNVSTYTPQINLCKSFVNLFFNQDVFNTYSKNQYAYNVPLALSEYTELYNNLRVPRDYKIEVVNNMLNNQVQNGTANITPANISPSCALQGLAQVRKNFQQSLFDGRLSYHTSATVRLTDEVTKESFVERGGIANTEGVKNSQICDALGIGSDYSGSLGFTRNFFNNNYSLKIESGVASGDAKLPASERDQFELIQTYVRNDEVLNMNNLVKTM
jgi:hypothetical protein